MPRNIGTGIYVIPPDTEGIPDQTIESAPYNTYIHDVETDLNNARPIIAGGTGANDADEALFNLGAEKSTQLVTNYDTHVWMPGSFRSASSATAGPVDGHAFAGIVYINESLADPPTNANVVVSARDMNDTAAPSRVYVREKKVGVWGSWTVIDATTLPFTPSGDLSATTILAAIQELDAEKASLTYVNTADATKADITAVDAADTNLQDQIDALTIASGQPVPTSGVYAVGTFMMLVLDEGLSVANGDTISGSSLWVPVWTQVVDVGFVVAPGTPGPQPAGTWKNVSGRAVGATGPSVGFIGYFVRTA